MTSLVTYLSSIKLHAHNSRLVILGNDAADLDSMASSIAYGYLRFLQDENLHPLPVIPIHRADFALRTEAVYVFNEAGINIDDVVFFDEIDLNSLLINGAKLVLVDHNNISPQLAGFSDNVVGVLDHHADEGLYLDALPRLIQPVGSTSSIVAQEYVQVGVDFSQDIAILLGGTILLDTVNLNPAAGRVTNVDLDIAAKLLPLCKLPQQVFFENVQREKFNIDGFSTRDLLRKDYKAFKCGTRHYGMASVLLSVIDWCKLDQDLFAEFERFSQSRDLDILISMNAFSHPRFSRDIAIYCKSSLEQDSLFQFLQQNGLELVAYDSYSFRCDSLDCVRMYQQGNLDVSRKKLQPLLQHYLAEKLNARQ